MKKENKMMNLTVGSVINGFRVLRDGEVPLLNARYWKLQHEATGATLYYSDRDDGQMVFSVGFRTLPEDDTGVFHILEHSCLDGSKNYQLKEPFVNLLKTSMAVDLNAMTYEDKTIYYFISTNEQDYMNLMSVYTDAVFNPLLLTDRRIFEKEAWHIEPAGEGKVAISGVVFNEMQGSLFSAAEIKASTITSALYGSGIFPGSATGAGAVGFITSAGGKPGLSTFSGAVGFGTNAGLTGSLTSVSTGFSTSIGYPEISGTAFSPSDTYGTFSRSLRGVIPVSAFTTYLSSYTRVLS